MAEEYIDDIDNLDEESSQLYEHFRFVVDAGQAPLRVDKYMFEKLQHSSRNRIQTAADAGFVHVNDHPVKSNYRVRPGDVVTLMLDRPRHDSTIEPEDIPLDIVYEDSELMVVNKPAGMVVHPRCGKLPRHAHQRHCLASAQSAYFRPQQSGSGSCAPHR